MKLRFGGLEAKKMEHLPLVGTGPEFKLLFLPAGRPLTIV